MARVLGGKEVKCNILLLFEMAESNVYLFIYRDGMFVFNLTRIVINNFGFICYYVVSYKIFDINHNLMIISNSNTQHSPV